MKHSQQKQDYDEGRSRTEKKINDGIIPGSFETLHKDFVVMPGFRCASPDLMVFCIVAEWATNRGGVEPG